MAPAMLLLALAGAGAAPVEPFAPSAPTQAKVVQPLAAAAKPAQERMICKAETRIGTLAGFQRVCHTNAEWQEIAVRARETWQEVQGKYGSTHSVEPGMDVAPAPRS